MAVFRADDFARGLFIMGREQFGVAIIGADDIEQVRQAVVVIVAGVGAEQRLGDGARRVVGMENPHQAGEDFQRRAAALGVSWISLPAL